MSVLKGTVSEIDQFVMAGLMLKFVSFKTSALGDKSWVCDVGLLFIMMRGLAVFIITSLHIR